MQDSILQTSLDNAEKGLTEFDQAMEPITGKKRKAEKPDKDKAKK